MGVTYTRLMHQTDARDISLGCVSAVQRALVNWFFVSIETQFHHAKRQRATDKDISAAI
jgi:hypothetical protein